MRINLSDGHPTTIYKWEVKEPKQIIQIVHGSLEQAARYEHFAKWLNTKGFSVWAIDLRGHGQEALDRNTLGYFGKDGIVRVIQDVNEISNKMREQYPGIPYTLLGHSMGSFIVRMAALNYQHIDNLIVVGTNHQNKLTSSINSFAAKVSNAMLSSKNKAHFSNKVSYKQLDKKIGAKESGEWISYNEKNRKVVKDDELCGFVFSRNAFKTMASWVNTINSKSKLKKQPKNKRVLFIAGEDDPVGNMSKEVAKAYSAYQKFGVESEIKIYPNMRHEILQEDKKTEVYKDIYNFCIKKGWD